MKGDLFSNSFVSLRISKIFFLDFVPDWTDIPAGLFITTKFSLFSTNIFDEFDKSSLEGLYF